MKTWCIADYWQATFLVLGVLIILMNIGLLFVHEPIETDRQAKQKETDKLIEERLGSRRMFYKLYCLYYGNYRWTNY